MNCLTENCYHKMTRRGRMDRHVNSWSIGLCPCCLKELVDIGSIVWSRGLGVIGCRQYLEQGEPVAKFGKNKPVIIKPKFKRTLFKNIKVNSDPSKVDRSLIF